MWAASPKGKSTFWGTTETQCCCVPHTRHLFESTRGHHMSARRSFMFDTFFAWGIVVMCSVILGVRPAPQWWRNVALGIIAATESLLWFRLLGQRRREPELAHLNFYRPAMVLWMAFILVSSRVFW